MNVQKNPGLALLVGLALHAALPASGEPPLKKASSAPKASSPAFDPAGLDRTADPCEDFFRYSCGTWLKANPIPAEYPSWGRFNELQERNREVLHGILEKAAAKPGTDFAERAIGDFYASCMDEARAEKEGLTPVQPLLDRIAALKTPAEAVVEAGRLRREGVPALFPLNSTQDSRDATEVIAEVDQGGLGLPDRDYYLEGRRQVEGRCEASTSTHVAKMLRARSATTAEAARGGPPAIVAIETEARQASHDARRAARPRADLLQDALARAEGAAPALRLGRVLRGDSACAAYATLNVAQPDFFKALERSSRRRRLGRWKTYLRWHVLGRLAPSLLTAAFVDEDFAFTARRLTGTQEHPAALEALRGRDGRASARRSAQPYVDEALRRRGARRAGPAMVQRPRAALDERHRGASPWMDDETRKAAPREARARSRTRSATPTSGATTTALEVAPRDATSANVRAARARSSPQRELAKIGKPVDRDGVGDDAADGERVLQPAAERDRLPRRHPPAAVLRPRRPTTPLNYGAHRHGHRPRAHARLRRRGPPVRRQGQPEGLVDASGRARSSRSAPRASRSSSTATRRGRRRARERQAHARREHRRPRRPEDRLRRAAEGAGKREPRRRSTASRPSSASSWAGPASGAANTPEFARLLAKTNPHSPPRFRVNGPVSNMPEFRAAFQWPEARRWRARRDLCEVW